LQEEPLWCRLKSMKSVGFCSQCGGLLEKGFLFCPYCGRELAEKTSAEELLGPSLDKLVNVAAKNSLCRLDTCRQALNTLEKELDDFLG